MKILSITRNNDFLRLYHKGRSTADPALVTYVLPNRSGAVRLGLTTGKKIGNAVLRNRARRVLRAAFREVSPGIKDGFDIVLVARTKTPYTKSTALTSILTAHLRKLGAYQSNEKT